MGALRQVQINPRTKTDEAESLPLVEFIAFFGPTHDSPGNESGNLDNCKLLPVIRLQPDGAEFILQCTALGIGGIEITRGVHYFIDLAGKRHSIDMHIEDIHENTDFIYMLFHKPVIENFFDKNNFTIGRRDQCVRGFGRRPLGIPEKIQDKSRYGQTEAGGDYTAEDGRNDGA